MKVFVIIGALVGLLCLLNWNNQNIKACYYAKGVKTVIDQNLIFDGKITKPMWIGSFSKGDYEACAFIGETL